MGGQADHSDTGKESLCDVLVIGGGPAGSTIAALLAEKGHRVTLLEKDRHPRFHIGESLLPANLPLFDRLGVRAQIEAIGLTKRGAEFVSPWHDHHQSFEFADAWDKSLPFAFQVRRSEFDRILIDNAQRKGAQVVQGCRVRKVDLAASRGPRIEAEHEDGRRQSWRSSYLVDASGRDTFLGNRLRIKHRNRKHNSSAVYAHFRGARRNEGKKEGHITIFWFAHGWFWFIPLTDGATSVGMVTWPQYMKTRSGSLREFLLDNIAQCSELAKRLEEAELVTDVEATGNFSYACDHSHGRNYLLLGDAYAFIDPVFSSGVMLAMNSAFAGATAIDISLRNPKQAVGALAEFDRLMKHGPKVFSWFIYRVTNPTLRNMFMAPRNFLRVKEAVLSVLAGDIFGKTPIWGSIRIFKAVYYISALINPSSSIRAWRRRKKNILYVEDQLEVEGR